MPVHSTAQPPPARRRIPEPARRAARPGGALGQQPFPATSRSSLPEDLRQFEPDLRELAGLGKLKRGKVEVRASVEIRRSQ